MWVLLDLNFTTVAGVTNSSLPASVRAVVEKVTGLYWWRCKCAHFDKVNEESRLLREAASRPVKRQRQVTMKIEPAGRSDWELASILFDRDLGNIPSDCCDEWSDPTTAILFYVALCDVP